MELDTLGGYSTNLLPSSRAVVNMVVFDDPGLRAYRDCSSPVWQKTFSRVRLRVKNLCIYDRLIKK